MWLICLCVASALDCIDRYAGAKKSIRLYENIAHTIDSESQWIGWKPDKLKLTMKDEWNELVCHCAQSVTVGNTFTSNQSIITTTRSSRNEINILPNTYRYQRALHNTRTQFPQKVWIIRLANPLLAKLTHRVCRVCVPAFMGCCKANGRVLMPMFSQIVHQSVRR